MVRGESAGNEIARLIKPEIDPYILSVFLFRLYSPWILSGENDNLPATSENLKNFWEKEVFLVENVFSSDKL